MRPTNGEMLYCEFMFFPFSVQGVFQMKMKRVLQTEPGTYQGSFAGVTETSHSDYGSGVRWDFQIDEGKYSGAIVSRTTKDVASTSNTCGKFWEMVSGLSLEAAIKCDTDEWVGDAGTIVVERSPSGDSVRVARFERDDAE